MAVAINGGAPYANGYNGDMGGITILNSTDGSAVVTNLDIDNWYTSVAFDNVGNVYGCSPTVNYWRVWSPPGPNTNTTVSLAQVIVTPSAPVIQITGITATPTGSGCATVTISFTGPSSLPVSESFNLVGAPALNGTYSAVAGAVLSGSSGAYNFTFSNCSTEFYKVELTGL